MKGPAMNENIPLNITPETLQILKRWTEGILEKVKEIAPNSLAAQATIEHCLHVVEASLYWQNRPTMEEEILELLKSYTRKDQQ
jgi:hypothetical protein